ncbi:oligosaccharide flippase family protein [Halotia branconii]|uniref:Oligosaccharide flippase family protein n=1 Tax=Halotia branconii CENA392 TaxID=1539056 RepID=A0AAJ6NWA7_9CYAN|nr:oligosaccharide flippase family protein [Halotia branconii]WGV27785.1 oligosaccharide flippase family protein [Halotia branconii CENA392]
MEKRKLINNSFSIITNRLAQSVSTFVLTATIARYLGAEALGQYLLAFSYYFIFVSIASQGLKTLFTRELACNPQKTPIFLTSGTCLQLIFSLIGYVALVIVVFLLPYSTETSAVCYIMGLTIIPFSLSNITEAIFQAHEKMHLIAISTVPIYVLRLIVMIWAMQHYYNVDFLSTVLVISESIILVIEWALLTSIVKPQWQIDKAFIWDSVKASRTFFAIEGIAIVNSRSQILILSLLGSEFLVGIYGGIVQLTQPFLIIANSVATAVFPSLSKAVNQGRENQRQIIENFIEILLIIALPLLAGLVIIGNKLLIFLYNPNFAQGSTALSVMALTLFFLPFNRSLSFLLLANGLEKINLREVIVTTILGSLASVVLISQFKLVGAAAVELLMRISGFSQYVYCTYTRIFSLNVWQIIRRPLLVSTLMIPVLLILQKINLNFLLTLLISSFYYLLIVGLLVINKLGSPQAIWSKLLNKG